MKMITNVIYNFKFYLRRPGFNLMSHGMVTSVVPHWDMAITLYGSNVTEAQKEMPEEYLEWNIVNIDYPIGWPYFPMFPSSTCSAGAVGVSFFKGEHYLRKV